MDDDTVKTFTTNEVRKMLDIADRKAQVKQVIKRNRSRSGDYNTAMTILDVYHSPDGIIVWVSD